MAVVYDLTAACGQCRIEMTLENVQVLQHNGSTVVKRTRQCPACSVLVSTYEVPQAVMDDLRDGSFTGPPVARSCGG